MLCGGGICRKGVSWVTAGRGLIGLFSKVYNGGGETAVPLPIFYRSNTRRGCFMKNVKNGKTQKGGN